MSHRLNRKQKIIFWMRILSIFSILISSYLLLLHYTKTSSFCDISPSLSCDIVNKSLYSEFPVGSNIPVSFLGILSFIFIFVLLHLIHEKKTITLFGHRWTDKHFSDILFYFLIFSLLFALYLVYTELFLILSVCILCVTLDILIVILLILSNKLRGVIHEKSA